MMMKTVKVVMMMMIKVVVVKFWVMLLRISFSASHKRRGVR